MSDNNTRIYYDNDYKLFQDNYYIHKHQKNIGRMVSGYENDEKGMPVQTITNFFFDLKQSANQAILTQYKSLFKNNIKNVSADTLILLNQTFKDNANITEINRQMQEALSQMLRTDKVAQIMKYQQNINWDVAQIDKAINQGMTKEKNYLEALNSMLDNIAKAVTVLNTKGNIVAAILIDAKNNIKNNNITNFSQLGEEILLKLKAKELELFGERNNDNILKVPPRTIASQQLFEVMDSLEKLAARFKTKTVSGKINKGDSITGQYIKDFVDRQFFSTILGETVAAGINSSVQTNFSITVANSIKNIKGTGRKTVEFEYTDEFGHYDNTYPKGLARQGKSDIRFDNVKLDLGYIFGNDSGSVTMGFGISNKAYKTLDMTGEDLKHAYVRGGSMSIGTILGMLTREEKIKYLSYNTFAWSSNSAPSQNPGKDMSSPLSALQDAMFTRSIVYMFGSRGRSDFANFMLINGKLVSLWEIIQEAISTQLLSSSQGGMGQAIMFRINEHKNFGKYLTSGSTVLRVAETNKIITNAKIEAHLNPSKF